jgi:curved DNA-binding protein CbpA
MKTPYDILAVNEQATDVEIKQAYLQKVKQYPPDHYHELFQQIHTAYQTIKDQKSRATYALFDYPEADFDALLDLALVSSEALALSAESFDKLLQASVTDSIFQFYTTDKNPST